MIDYDGDAASLVTGCIDRVSGFQSQLVEAAERDYQNFHAFLDMTDRDPSRANVAIPKLFSIIMGKAPQLIKALVGQRPYIPFEARREEYKEAARLQSILMDEYLSRGGFKLEFSLTEIMAVLFGTCYLEPMPYLHTQYQATLVPIEQMGPYGVEQTGRYVRQYEPTERLQFRFTPYALWDVLHHENARTLREKGGCPWVIKMRLVSRRHLKKLAAEGAYGDGFDAEKLTWSRDDMAYTDMEDHDGLNILKNMGYMAPAPDGDTALLFRYESEDRYIDMLGKDLVLRDRDNPFTEKEGGHGLINLCKITHNINPHTQARWRGNGEAKVNEVLTSLLNENLSATIDSINMMNQGVVIYARDRGVEPDDLVMAAGNKIGFTVNPGERINDMYNTTFGSPLPRDHHLLREQIEQYIDLGAQWYEVNRGEKVPGDPTLGEVGILKAAGDAPLEMSVSIVEEEFMADMGRKMLCHVEQFANDDDLIEILGEEDAAKLMYLNPQDLPGGYNFTFKGSDKVVNQYIKQKNLQLLDDRLNGSPWLNEREWLKQLLIAHGLDDELEDVLYTEEEFMEMQQSIAQQEAAQMQVPGVNPAAEQQQLARGGM